MEANSGNNVDSGSQTKQTSGAGKQRSRGRTMLVRYGKMGMVGLFAHSEREIPQTDRHVVVNTERGMEIGEIISPYCHGRGSCEISDETINAYSQASGPNYPFTRQGQFVRFASEDDRNEQRHLDVAARDKGQRCQELISRHDLAMELVDVEHLFGGDRIIFYFMAEGRVDFRSLVKELAGEYQTRIEMRQIGARDEARLVADYETCGRQCCCKNFLKVLQPVNMRMAKMQKATLDPSKISGRCGRLKCCLRYEDQVYGELVRNLPRNNTTVLTEQGTGRVIETQIITQLVKIRLDNGRLMAISVDEIMECNYKGPAVQGAESQGKVVELPEDPPSRKEQEDSSPPADEGQGGARKKRRRKRRKKKNNDGA